MFEDTSRKFGRYELLGRLARGGMGEIYLARFSGVAGFEKRCVIKKILPELAQSTTFVEKFLNEGRTLVALTHSNIVQIYDMGCEDGEYYLAMEHIEGADLRFLLRQFSLRNRQIRLEVCCYIIMEVLKGLSYAHRVTDQNGKPLGIIHRDISPSNLLISNQGEVKIIDFGIAKNEARTQQSTASMVQGKFAYMSPEQARGEDLDPRTDLFSLGIVFYEMLTGVRPFEGSSDLQSIERVKTQDAPPLSNYRDDIPETLAEIIDKALQKNREDRFSSADAFYDALEAFLLNDGLTPKARDVIAEFDPIMKGEEALVVHSSEDFFDEAFQALLDAQAQSGQGQQTRSMCLTKSFSQELPKADAEDFGLTTGSLKQKIEEDVCAPHPVENDIAPLTPAQITRQKRIKRFFTRIRYGAVGAVFATLILAIAFTQGWGLFKGLYKENSEIPSTTASAAEPATSNDAAQLANIEPFVLSELLKKTGIELTIHTTPENAKLYIKEGSYKDLADKRLRIIPNQDAVFEISAEGYETCSFTIRFDNEMPRINWQHCTGVSTQYERDMMSAVINIELSRKVTTRAAELPGVSAIQPLERKEPRRATKQRPREEVPEAPKQTQTKTFSLSLRSDSAAILKLNGEEYALPTEVTAEAGTTATIIPINTSRDIVVPQKITVKSDQNLTVSFCRAIIHVNEFYVPGDPSPYQIADILVDNTVYANDTDMATFTLPCGKHTFSARFSVDGINLSASQSATVNNNNVFRTSLSLRPTN